MYVKTVINLHGLSRLYNDSLAAGTSLLKQQIIGNEGFLFTSGGPLPSPHCCFEVFHSRARIQTHAHARARTHTNTQVCVCVCMSATQKPQRKNQFRFEATASHIARAHVRVLARVHHLCKRIYASFIKPKDEKNVCVLTLQTKVSEN